MDHVVSNYKFKLFLSFEEEIRSDRSTCVDARLQDVPRSFFPDIPIFGAAAAALLLDLAKNRKT